MTREIMDLLTSLSAERGLTVVMVTHEPQAAAYAQRVIHSLDGRVDREATNGYEAGKGQVS